VPATSLVERAQVGEQAVHGRIEVRRLFGDPLPQLIELTVHATAISPGSDIPYASSAMLDELCTFTA